MFRDFIMWWVKLELLTLPPEPGPLTGFSGLWERSGSERIFSRSRFKFGLLSWYIGRAWGVTIVPVPVNSCAFLGFGFFTTHSFTPFTEDLGL